MIEPSSPEVGPVFRVCRHRDGGRASPSTRAVGPRSIGVSGKRNPNKAAHVGRRRPAGPAAHALAATHGHDAEGPPFSGRVGPHVHARTRQSMAKLRDEPRLRRDSRKPSRPFR
ncbi:hypothetical protein MRX96_012542 [Rhipicephalus microplus]